MTGRATFGAFLQAAHRHLEDAAGLHGPAGARGSVEEVGRSLLRVITVMGRYVQDVTTAFGDVPARTRPALNPWAGASVQAREALANSAGFLLRQGAGRRRRAGVPAVSPLARRLDAVAISLTTGRDLLQTHFAVGADGARQQRSEWGVVITSPPVTRALLAELGSLSRQIARQGADLALSPSARARWDGNERRALNAACQWLWVLDASVQAACQREPVLEGERDLLAAIPVNVLTARRLPDGGEPVSVICDGVIASAERVRQLAWGAAERASWSPGMSVTSLRHVAEASTVTSHNCHVLLQALTARTRQAGLAELSAQLSAAADSAGPARGKWLHAARAVAQITTDTRGHLSGAAAETGDLALWTGRLAYADPQWTLASGPTYTARPPESLAPSPQDVPVALAAVHQACETLTRLTSTEQEQIRAAARAGRILVPTRSLSDDFDIPHPFARAPKDRVEELLSHYQDAAQASRQVTTAVGEVAAAIRAPSRMLTAARAATEPGRRIGPGKASGQLAGPSTWDGRHAMPGPVERALRGLGVTHPGLLAQGTEMDRASERLIIDAATRLEPQRGRPSASMLNRSAGTAALVNHVLASGDPRAVALLLRRAEQPHREQPEPEP